MPLDPNDLLRLAALLKMHGETVRLFSDTQAGGNGKISRITAIAVQIEAISVDLADAARELGASEAPEATE